MNITLYQNQSEYNKIGKSLILVESLSGNMRNETSIIKPEILVNRTDPTGFNYVFISELNRYYFVDDVEVLRTGVLVIKLRVDVLESFKTGILAQTAIVSKTTTPNLYLPDENLKTMVKTKTDIVNFPSGLLENGEFILITAGGIPTL